MGIRVPHGLSHISMPLPRPHKQGYVPPHGLSHISMPLPPIFLCHRENTRFFNPPISLCRSSGISPISLCRSSYISMPFLLYLYAVPPISLCHTCLNALIFNVFLPRKILKTLKIIKNGVFTRALALSSYRKKLYICAVKRGL